MSAFLRDNQTLLQLFATKQIYFNVNKQSLTVEGLRCMQNRSSFQDHALDFWLARGAVLMIAGLQLMFVNDSLIFGARWIAPTIEILMLIPLSFATGWTQGQARQAESDDHWHIIRRNRR